MISLIKNSENIIICSIWSYPVGEIKTDLYPTYTLCSAAEIRSYHIACKEMCLKKGISTLLLQVKQPQKAWGNTIPPENMLPYPITNRYPPLNTYSAKALFLNTKQAWVFLKTNHKSRRCKQNFCLTAGWCNGINIIVNNTPLGYIKMRTFLKT